MYKNDFDGTDEGGLAVANAFGSDNDGMLTVEQLKWMLKKLPDDMPVFVEHVDGQEYMALEDQQHIMYEECIEGMEYRFLRGVETVTTDNKFFITVYKNQKF